MSLRYIIFEGRKYERRSLGRIFRRGPSLLAELDGRVQTLWEYPSVRLAEWGKRYLLARLYKRRPKEKIKWVNQRRKMAEDPFNRNHPNKTMGVNWP